MAIAVLAVGLAAFHEPPLLGGESVHVHEDHIDRHPIPGLDAGLSFQQPLRVRRDNPWFGEEFELLAGESSSCSPFSTYCSFQWRWSGLDATLHADEWRRDGSRPRAGNPLYFRVPKTIGTPLRPSPGEHVGPGTFEWQARGFDLVPGNVYELRQKHKHLASGEVHPSPGSLFVTLADDVLAVPIVILNWVDPPWLSFKAMFELGARNLLDFQPTSTSFLFTEVLDALGEPDGFELPPDDVWEQCGIQFQVIASYSFDTRILPARAPGRVCLPGEPRCDSGRTVYLEAASGSGVDEPSRDSAILAEDPEAGPLLVGDVSSAGDGPAIFVNFGDFDCPGFIGNTRAGKRNVDIDIGEATGLTTAHELGHALDLDHRGTPGDGQLMNPNPVGRSDRRIDDCATARAKAAAFDAKYRELNVALGRTLPMPGPPPGPPLEFDPQAPFGVDEACCREDDFTVTRMPSALCGLAGGTVVPEAQCTVCCVVSSSPPSAGKVPPAQCADPIPLSQCATVCCDEPSNETTRYACAQSGGSEVPCAVECRLPASGTAYAGPFTTFLRLDDGRVLAAGDGSHGELGAEVASATSLPREVAGLQGAVAIASGERHTLVLMPGGAVLAMGDNGHGQLGDGARAGRATPAEVAGLPPVAAVAAGAAHSLAVDTMGRVWAWGANAFRQVGTASEADVLAPVLVLGDAGGGGVIGDFSVTVTAVAAGARHSLALASTGAVFAWGSNDSGQLAAELGVTGSETPAQVFAAPDVPLGSVVSISAGGLHSLALLASGEVVAWGANGYGQLGDGTVGQLADGSREIRPLPRAITLDAPPACSAARAVPEALWPPNHKLTEIAVEGVLDPEGGPVSVEITSVVQDEGRGGAADAVLLGGERAKLRRERDGGGDGRVYTVSFVATDAAGNDCTGSVHVCVPHDQGSGPSCTHSGVTFGSTE